MTIIAKASEVTGGEFVCRELVRREVKYLFGICGGAVLPIFDALNDEKALHFILAHHEQSAGHMAEGYARVSGKPGVVLVTSGPGTSNIATPLLDARLDGIPMVAICGQVATSVQGTGAFQWIDSLALARCCTKWCGMPQQVKELPGCIATAFHMATHGRPGPTMVIVPRDVASARFTPSEMDLVGDSSPVPQCPGDMDVSTPLNEVVRRIQLAEKPVIIAGNGVVCTANGSDLLRKLSKVASIPVTTTLLGMGAVDELDPLALGMLGTYGTVPANLAVQNADLILAVGARLDQRAVAHAAGFGPVARETAARHRRGGIIHFDIDPGNIGKTVEPTIAVIGDLASTLPRLLLLITTTIAPRLKWLRQIQEWKARYPLAFQPPQELPPRLLPQEVITELDVQTQGQKSSTIVTTGVGQHQMWTARHYRWREPLGLISSGGLGTMGYGVPAAIGVKLARPDVTVIDIDGDASLCMTMDAILTAVQHHVEIKIVVLRNEQQGMVEELQMAEVRGRVIHTKQRNADLVKLVESMGGQGRCCSRREELEESVRWVLAAKGIVLLDIVTESSVPMIPKVPANRGLEAIVDSLPAGRK
ncbi:acetolactate synthase [Aspergillus ellipticus CBS 707.79]|uniref:Acetolactate synthase n=1 Tax=Aspergillus ellipticus CBS 707.79 TaxID=1448320 RepID=A0A319EBT7_9EURO|nr:acetolactate synthase [Aspergillus ellipticus CBS 707.79]